jgi:two-component system response regulator
VTQPLTRTPHLLLVEDNLDDELLTRRALGRQGFEAHLDVAHDGFEALELLLHASTDEVHQEARLPSVVLLDWKLPRLPAVEVLRRLRSVPRTQLLPIVVFTSSLETRDLVDAYRNGANSYVRKPIDSEEFATTLRALSRYWLGLNESVPIPARE